MKEIEVKVLEINKVRIVKKLLKLGAKKVFEGRVKSLFYDFEDSRLTRNDSFLRLRKKGKDTYLTFKKKISQDGVKIMDEFEIRVNDFEAIRSILNFLGLTDFKTYTKKRTSYQIGKTLFEIDEFESIPAYMEIEAPSKELVNYFIELLKIDKQKIKSWDGEELLNYYINKD